MSEHKLTTTIGDDTEVRVYFEYEPHCLGRGDHPDVPEQVHINYIHLRDGGFVIDMRSMSEREIDNIRVECLEQIHKQRDEDEAAAEMRADAQRAAREART